jgi:pilus assembly protein TadC
MTLLAEIPPGAYASAALAGLAVLLALARPGGRWRAVSGAAPRTPSWSDRVGVLIRGRPDAPSLPVRLLLGAAGAGALCALGSRAVGGLGGGCWAAWPVLALGGAVGLGWLEPQRAKRRRQQLILDSPQALELMSACLAAGMPVRGANRAVVASFDGPVAEDLGRVQSLVGLGVSDSDAWLTLHDHPQLGAAADDLARSVESGTMLVSSLTLHARVAREARRAALLVRARSVGVRSVLPLMVCFIPAFMLLGVVPTVVSAVSRALQ